MYNGAKAAEAALGANVDYQWSDWDPAKMITQFSEAVATQPDGIAVMGHPGDDAFKPLIDEAVAQGIVVTVMNTELPATQAEHAPAGTGYVGAVLYTAGWDLAKEAIKRGGLVEGDKAFVWGLLSQAGRGERTKGVVEGLEDGGMEVVYLEIDDATNADPAQGIPAFTGMASANPDLKAAFFDHGNLTSTAQSYLEAAGLGPDDLYVAGFDLSPATVAASPSSTIPAAAGRRAFPCLPANTPTKPGTPCNTGRMLPGLMRGTHRIRGACLPKSCTTPATATTTSANGTWTTGAPRGIQTPLGPCNAASITPIGSAANTTSSIPTG